MFGCARATVVLASSTKRRTKSSSQASSSRICLTTSFFSKPPAPRNVASTTRAIPPRASSRSSTYLPKTWGYIRVLVRPPHRSKHAAALVVGVVLAAACHPSPQVTTRTVTMYVPQACAADGGAYGDYFALGDYDPSTPPPTTGHPLSAVGVALPEIDSRALELM